MEIKNSISKEHARWKSEHGHWIKDLEIWHARNLEAQDILDDMERSLKDFSNQVERHIVHIEKHGHLIRMHEDALAWRREHPPKKVDKNDSVSHQFQQKIHRKEYEIHESLRQIQNRLIDDVCKLGDTFGFTT